MKAEAFHRIYKLTPAIKITSRYIMDYGKG
jgi:hypothetical protein